MHITVNQIAAEDTLSKLGPFTLDLEAALNRFLSEESFGAIGRYLFVILAVEEDPKANMFFFKRNNRIGTYVHPVSNEKIKYLSIAIPYNPVKILTSSVDALRIDLCSEIISRVENPQLKIPKDVDYDRFSEKIKLALQIYKRAQIIDDIA